MLLKKGTHSEDLRILRALEKTYPSSRTAISKMISGVEGEKSTAHYVDRDFARDDDFAVLHDVRIGMVGDLAQSDHLVIDRLTGILWVLETKNNAGTLSWNEHGDWTAIYGSRTIAIESPTAQAQRHCTSIAEWLRHKGIRVSGVRPVVLVGAKTNLSRGMTPDDVPVMKADVFPGWLRARRMERMATATRMEMSMQDMREIAQRIADAHVPPQDWKRRLMLPAVPPAEIKPRPIRGSQRRDGRSGNTGHASSNSRVAALSIGAAGIIILALAAQKPQHPRPEVDETKSTVPTMRHPDVVNAQAHTSKPRRNVAERNVFPDHGTIRWGTEQPIGGNMARLDVWDATESPQDKVVNVRSAFVVALPGMSTPPYATIYVKAGKRAGIRLPADRPYRITAMSGDNWQGSEALFGADATTVDFGMVSLNPKQPQVVVMGAPDQTTTVVARERF